MCCERAHSLIYYNTCHLEPGCQKTVFLHNYVSRRYGFVENLKAQRESVGGTGPGESCWLLFVSVGSSRGVLFWMGLLQFELQWIRILPQRGHDILFHQHMDNESRGFIFRGLFHTVTIKRLFNGGGSQKWSNTVLVQFNQCADISSQC